MAGFSIVWAKRRPACAAGQFTIPKGMPWEMQDERQRATDWFRAAARPDRYRLRGALEDRQAGGATTGSSQKPPRGDGRDRWRWRADVGDARRPGVEKVGVNWSAVRGELSPTAAMAATACRSRWSALLGQRHPALSRICRTPCAGGAMEHRQFLDAGLHGGSGERT